MVIKVDDSVRLVMIQFSFSNYIVVPTSVKFVSPETKEEYAARKASETGTLVIEPTMGVSAEELVNDLEALGYELVSSFYQERLKPDLRTKYHVVRFTFARREFAKVSDWFRQLRSAIRSDLLALCSNALWRCRAYRNPFIGEGKEIPGQYAMSVNLEVRQPLFHPDGKAVCMWEKDEKGNRLGDAPVPIGPAHYLRVMD